MEPMRPADNHVHTEWSWDTPMGTTMAAACERAVEGGIPAVAFTEHLDFTVWGEGDVVVPADVVISSREHVLPLDVTGYLESVEKCRSRFPELRIRSGVECGEPHRFAGSVAAVLAQGTFDRVLGSLHSMHDAGRVIGVDRLLSREDADSVMRRYFAEAVELVEGSAAFEVLAHVDFPRRYWPHGVEAYDELAYEEEYRAVFRALAASGRVLEFNTRSPLWTSRLLGWWRDEGGRAVSFGSDAHNAWRVGARFDLAVDIAAAAGFGPGRDAFDFWRTTGH